MTKYMRISAYCEASGMSKSIITKAIHGKYGKKFAKKISEAPNSPYIINTEEFEKLYEKGAFND